MKSSAANCDSQLLQRSLDDLLSEQQEDWLVEQFGNVATGQLDGALSRTSLVFCDSHRDVLASLPSVERFVFEAAVSDYVRLRSVGVNCKQRERHGQRRGYSHHGNSLSDAVENVLFGIGNLDSGLFEMQCPTARPGLLGLGRLSAV